MTQWHSELLERLNAQLPDGNIQVYGSALAPNGMDAWSDLDVRFHCHAATRADELLAAPVWAWQESRSTDGQQLRLVLHDGRRVDALVSGFALELPATAPDNDVRFDAALAASRIGRGNQLIGLHLLFGILREVLVQGMLGADRDAGTRHHRFGTHHDERAQIVATIVAGEIHPSTVLEACELYGLWRSAIEPGYVADWSGLRSVIDRGEAPSAT